MIRFAVVAAVAALAAAQPAAAAEVRVSLVGKSQAQIEADITRAARTVCLEATSNDTFRTHALSACVRDTVKSTLQKI